jgi:methyltransferase (TIGR00027 family)
MRAGVASKTALGVAIRRAAHQIFDSPVVFHDPLAQRIIGDTGGASLSGKADTSRGLRAFVIARSQFAEDELAEFYARGIRSYVILGAGLDTFAYRNPYSPELKVFEVDHPDTQNWKMERLRAGGIEVPESLRFVPVDFEMQPLGQALRDAPGFETTRPVFFSLLGVTPYLTHKTLLTTLEAIASMPSGSGVVFDYAVPAASLSLMDKIGLSALSARVEQAGESFRLFIEPPKLRGILEELGLACTEDMGRQEINSLYFQNRKDGLRVRSNLGRIVCAVSVKKPQA